MLSWTQDVLPTFNNGFNMALRLWSRLQSSFILGSNAVAALFVQDSTVPFLQRQEYMTRYQAAEDFFRFLMNMPEMAFSHPLVQIISSRTECACTPGFQGKRAEPNRIPMLEVGFPNNSLSQEILQKLDRDKSDSVCPNAVCQGLIRHSATTRFHQASEALVVSVQRKSFNRVTNTFSKDNRPIDVGQNLDIDLEGGGRVSYELIGGIQHDGGYDELGNLTSAQHYYAILLHQGQYHIVNQTQPITQSENGLSMCQMFLYKRIDQGLNDHDHSMQ